MWHQLGPVHTNVAIDNESEVDKNCIRDFELVELRECAPKSLGTAEQPSISLGHGYTLRNGTHRLKLIPLERYDREKPKSSAASPS